MSNTTTSKAMAEVVKAALAAEGFVGVSVRADYKVGGLWRLYMDHADYVTLAAATKVARAAISAAVDGIRLAPVKAGARTCWALRSTHDGRAIGGYRMGLLWKADAETTARMDAAVLRGLGMATA